MFVALSKTADLLLEPIVWVVALAALAVLLRRRPRAATALGVLAPALLWALSTDAAADALTGWVEEGARDTSRPGVYDAVIVLGGAMDPGGTAAAGRLELNAGADRYVAAFEVLRSGRARAAVLSGGALWPRPGAIVEADLAARMLANWGVDPARIVPEGRSRNTRENAVEVARIVAERGWRRLLLVTSAAHVVRAAGCFRAVGLEPDVLPVDWRRGGGDGGFSPGRLAPRSQALAQSADALRELAGRVVYRAVGYAR